MKRYFALTVPKPLSFVISLLLIALIMSAVGSYLAGNSLPVGTGGVKVNATLEDIAQRFYEDINN